mmetsp:Transcript_92092/g.249881  ORF Transcript_92092/g.249881 Transcript_92092/m.249881 type:complete len:215 (-) Transcript_92092:210-854(-)
MSGGASSSLAGADVPERPENLTCHLLLRCCLRVTRSANGPADRQNVQRKSPSSVTSPPAASSSAGRARVSIAASTSFFLSSFWWLRPFTCTAAATRHWNGPASHREHRYSACVALWPASPPRTMPRSASSGVTSAATDRSGGFAGPGRFGASDLSGRVFNRCSFEARCVSRASMRSIGPLLHREHHRAPLRTTTPCSCQPGVRATAGAVSARAL